MNILENLHKNQQWAFIDGVLCGIVITVLVMKNHAKNQELKEVDRELDDLEEKTQILERMLNR